MKLLRILLLTLIFCLFASAAHAYIDPGTGSLIIQLVIGTLAAASLFFKSFWLRVKGIFSSSSSSTTSSPESPNSPQKTSDGDSSESNSPKNNTPSS